MLQEVKELRRELAELRKTVGRAAGGVSRLLPARLAQRIGHHRAVFAHRFRGAGR